MKKCKIFINNSLAFAKEKKLYKIDGINSAIGSHYKIRLQELGFIDGEIVEVLKKSFLGKTLIVAVMGYALSIRSSLAENIYVSEVI